MSETQPACCQRYGGGHDPAFSVAGCPQRPELRDPVTPEQREAFRRTARRVFSPDRLLAEMRAAVEAYYGTADTAEADKHARTAMRKAASLDRRLSAGDRLPEAWQPQRFRVPAWLHERVNDPYGTPNKHGFWSGPIGGLAERIGVWKVFTYGGWVHGYDTQHNAWAHFASTAEAREHCSKPAIDPWS